VAKSTVAFRWPPEWLAEAVLEIVDRFGAAGYETQKVEGQWRSGGWNFLPTRGRTLCRSESISRAAAGS